MGKTFTDKAFAGIGQLFLGVSRQLFAQADLPTCNYAAFT